MDDESPALEALIQFCRQPEPAQPGFNMSYDAQRLTELVTDALSEAESDETTHPLLLKILKDSGWDEIIEDFECHDSDEEVNLPELLDKLTNRSSVPKHVGIRFCPECNNMLYPAEDKENHQLVYQCRICPNIKEQAEHNCIYVSRMARDVDTLAQVNRDLASDPALPHTRGHFEVECPNCGFDDAVFFQAQSNRDKSNMMLFYVCCKCGQKWRDSYDKDFQDNPDVGVDAEVN